MTPQSFNPGKAIEVVDRLDEVESLCHALDMALENDASQNSDALRTLLDTISKKVHKARTCADEVRAEACK